MRLVSSLSVLLPALRAVVPLEAARAQYVGTVVQLTQDKVYAEEDFEQTHNSSYHSSWSWDDKLQGSVTSCWCANEIYVANQNTEMLHVVTIKLCIPDVY